MKRISLVVLITFTYVIFLSKPGYSQSIELGELTQETFRFPLGIEYSNPGSPYIYIVQRNGIIRKLNTEQPEQLSEVWFDISNKIQEEGEKGLLGLAFHPNYPGNETFYVNYNYVDNTGQLETRISRFKAPGGESNPQSEEILLSFDQPSSNHNGGQLKFGPDGYLYISLGDGGGYQNRMNSQDLTDVMGDVLRIDVNTETGYNIPGGGNPFIDKPDAMG